MFCSNCGSKNAEIQTPAEMVPAPASQPNALIADSISAIKQTFTANPEKALDTAINTNPQ